jgi:hypothetical protein
MGDPGIKNSKLSTIVISWVRPDHLSSVSMDKARARQAVAPLSLTSLVEVNPAYTADSFLHPELKDFTGPAGSVRTTR